MYIFREVHTVLILNYYFKSESVIFDFLIKFNELGKNQSNFNIFLWVQMVVESSFVFIFLLKTILKEIVGH